MRWIEFLEIAGILCVALELFFLFAEARKSRDAQRKLATLEYLTAHFDEYRQFRDWLDSFPPERLERPQELTDEELSKIRGYLIMVERLAVGVGQGMFSFDYVANVTNKNIRRAYIALRPHILSQREASKSEKIWDAFEWLVFELDKSASGAERLFPREWRGNGVFLPTKDFLRIKAR